MKFDCFNMKKFIKLNTGIEKENIEPKIDNIKRRSRDKERRNKEKLR